MSSELLLVHVAADTMLLFFFWVHMQNTERKIDKEDRFRHSRYLVGALLPFLKLLRQEQVMEKEAEANIQGMNFYFLYLFPRLHLWMGGVWF